MTNWFLEGAGLTIPGSYWDLGFSLGSWPCFRWHSLNVFQVLGFFLNDSPLSKMYMSKSLL